MYIRENTNKIAKFSGSTSKELKKWRKFGEDFFEAFFRPNGPVVYGNEARKIFFCIVLFAGFLWLVLTILELPLSYLE